MGSLQETVYCTLAGIQVPVCVEIVYRALVCRIVDPNFEHTSFFTFFSAILFSASHFANYYKLNEKYGSEFAFKTSCTDHMM
jgi:hypothetical protein